MKRCLAFALRILLLFTQFSLSEETPFIYDGVEVPLKAEVINGQYKSFPGKNSYVLFQSVDLKITKLLMPNIMSMVMNTLGVTDY